MVTKIFVANADRARVAKQLLAAADDVSDVRVDRSDGFGFVIPDGLAEKMGLTGAESSLDTGEPEEKKEEDPQPDDDHTNDEDTEQPDKPKRGRPRGKKSKGE